MKKLTFDEFYKEVDKLKKRAKKLNEVSPNLMIVISTRIKSKKK